VKNRIKSSLIRPSSKKQNKRERRKVEEAFQKKFLDLSTKGNLLNLGIFLNPRKLGISF